MNLRPELAPNIKEAEKLFPKVMELIDQFDDAVDQGDEHKMGFVLKQLNEITNKNLEKESLYEYWSYISIEDLAFKLSLPLPQKVTTIDEQEILEIENRMQLLEKATPSLHENISKLLHNHGVTISHILIDAYYQPLLELNNPSPPTNVIHL